MLTLADQVRKEMGVSDELFHRLATEDGRQDWQRLFAGMTETDGKKHLINCDADPFVPEGWEVIEHRMGGQFEWNPDKIELYLCDEQKSGSIEGNKLKKKLEGKPVLNACALNYLLEHPDLIPEDWKNKCIFFWGTVYRDSCSRALLVRCLCWIDDRWGWNFRWLGCQWLGANPAAFCK